jgi:hypothetical protein
MKNQRRFHWRKKIEGNNKKDYMGIKNVPLEKEKEKRKKDNKD